jgi:hypothetical protein
MRPFGVGIASAVRVVTPTTPSGRRHPRRARTTTCDAGRNPDASPPSRHEPRCPRVHTVLRQTDTPRKIHVLNRAEPPIIELAARNNPRRRKAKGQLEKIGVLQDKRGPLDDR